MPLTITNDKIDETNWLSDDGTSPRARGGSEMIRDVLKERLPADLMEQFKIIHSRVRDNMFEEGKKHLLLCHDTWDDPEAKHMSKKESLQRFEKLLFVSNYQMATFNMAHGVPYAHSAVLKNAIDPIPKHKKPADQINLIYHTTPHRGLDILVAAFDKLCETHDNIHLDVFSSFEIYGWEERDKPYQKLFERCREHPSIDYHGTVENHVIREKLQESHIFAYPCVWPETSCIAMMEAMSAGCSIVCPNFAALPETTANFALMYPWSEDNNHHAHTFYHTLDMAIRVHNEEDLQTKLHFQKIYTDSFYNWDLRLGEWEGLLRSLA